MHPRFLAPIALLLGLLACNLGGPALTQPSDSVASGTAAEPGIPVSATPIRLVIPAGLATGASAETIDVVTDQTGAPWDVAPAHLQLTFEGYALGNSFHVPQLFVYPAQQYASMHPAAAESLKRLQAILADPSGPLSQDTLPRVPFFNAGQVFAAQQQVIHFSGGSGVRFITQYAQDVSPINNSGLFYALAGLTGDGKYYIVSILPVNLPFLAPDNNPNSALPAGGIPFPPSSTSGSGFEDYYRQVAQRIDAAPADQFTPPLATLDGLIQSLIVDH
jgi:hypothetical protein